MKSVVKSYLLNMFFTISKMLSLDKDTSRVICYHSIGNLDNKYSTTIDEFKNELLKIKKTYKFVSLDQMIFGNNKHKSPEIALTVDDGYEDILKVKDFLQNNEIPVTLFVLSNSNKANRKEIAHNGKQLNIAQIKGLHKLGWEIGCHSATHADFSKLNKKDLQKEIIEAKQSLEKKLGSEIKYFAYPKGIYSEEIISLLKKARYKAAFTTFPGLLSKTINLYKIPRFVMERNNYAYFIPSSFSQSTELLRKISRFL